MRYNITKSDAFPLVQITLKHNEEIKIESNAMVYHTHGIELSDDHSSYKKLGSISRTTFASENFFKNVHVH